MREDITYFALLFLLVLQMQNWLPDSSDTDYSWVHVRNYSLGSLSAKTCYKRDGGGKGETSRKKEGAATASNSLKETKALPFSDLFFYCCPLWARLLGLLHNTRPLWAAHHWLSCHFKLVSLLRTAAPEAWTHLSWKTCPGHTHTLAHSESIRRCRAKWEHKGNLHQSF